MFTSGILSGSFFPGIYTPEGRYTKVNARPSDNNQNANAVTSQGPQTGIEPSPAPNNAQTMAVKTSPTTTPIPSPTPKPVPEQGLNVFDFLAESGPAGGKDYALLIVWCFIAGFAERFVPDALDRLISNEQSVTGK